MANDIQQGIEDAPGPAALRDNVLMRESHVFQHGANDIGRGYISLRTILAAVTFQQLLWNPLMGQPVRYALWAPPDGYPSIRHNSAVFPRRAVVSSPTIWGRRGCA